MGGDGGRVSLFTNCIVKFGLHLNELFKRVFSERESVYDAANDVRSDIFDAFVYFYVRRLVLEVKYLHHVAEAFCGFIFRVAVFALVVLPLLLLLDIFFADFPRRVLFGAARLGTVLPNVIDDLF